MARISSPWVGISKGKLGEGVYYHANGKQLARARNRQPANPRTDKQAVQRMVLASASKALAALRPLYDHSAEGVQVGQQSIFHWQRILTQGFRAAAASALETDAVEVSSEFAIKGAPMIAVYDGMPLSEGRLTFRPIVKVEDSELTLSIAEALSTSNLTTQSAYAAELAKLGLEPGDQISFVYIATNSSQPVASFDDATNLASVTRYARITFKSEIPEGFAGGLILSSAGVSQFNPALIEKREGNFPFVTAEDDTLVFQAVRPAGFSTLAATIVRSQKQSSGKTYYNSAKFVQDVETFASNNAGSVYPSYMDNAEGIEVGSPLYLKNAIISPN